MSSRQVKCPRCGKLSLFSPENPSRPFCSDRCKLIDLGQWADEKYAIPVKPASEADLLDHLDELGEGEEEGHDYSSGDAPNETPNETIDTSSDGRIH